MLSKTGPNEVLLCVPQALSDRVVALSDLPPNLYSLKLAEHECTTRAHHPAARPKC